MLNKWNCYNELQETNFIIYKAKDGNINVDVVLKNKMIQMIQKRMSVLFEVNIW